MAGFYAVIYYFRRRICDIYNRRSESSAYFGFTFNYSFCSRQKSA